MNEDTTPERLALRSSRARTAVVVAGSGERVIALLDLPQLERLIVVDSNPDALRLVQAKLEALRVLELDDYLALLGHRAAPAARRCQLWQRLRSAPPMGSLGVGAGLLHVGALERWFALLRPWLHVWLGRRFTRWVQAGLPPAPAGALPARRFAALLWLFRRRFVYRWTGNRDPAFVGADADYSRMAEVFAAGLHAGTLGANPMAHLVFAGHLRGMAPPLMPFSLQPAVLAAARQRLASLPIEFVEANLADPASDARLRWGRPGEATFSSLSDLASFLPPEDCVRIVARATAARGATAVARSFLRNRLPLRPAGRDWSADEGTGMYDVHEYRSMI